MSRTPAAEGNQRVTLVEPHRGVEVGPTGAFGRYGDSLGNSLLIRHLPFSVADATTDGAIVPAVANYLIAVVGFFLQAGATAQTFVFNTKPAGAGAAISNVFQNGANGSVSRPIIYGGSYFQTLAGEGLTGTTSSAAAAATKGMIDYVLVPDPSIQWADGTPVLDANGQTISL